MADWKAEAREHIKRAVEENQFAAAEGCCCWFLEKALAEIEELDGKLRAAREMDISGPDN